MKSSRSMNSTQAEPSSRPVRASAWISRSRHSARFASPVSGSCSASWRICSSLRRRPIAVASTLAMPRRKFSWSSLSGCAGTTLTSPKTSSPVRISKRSAAPPAAGPQAASVTASRTTNAPVSGSVSRSCSTASAARSATSAPASARSPSAATAATWRRLALHARERLAVGGHVAPDRQQQRARLGLDDAPAHLADELGPVAAQAVGAGREAQRVVGREVELHVARVAVAQALRPQHLDRLAEQLVVVVAEQRLGVGVDEHDPPVAAGGDRRVRQALEHRAQRGLAPAQALLQAYGIDGLGCTHAHGREEEGFQVPRIVVCPLPCPARSASLRRLVTRQQ